MQYIYHLLTEQDTRCYLRQVSTVASGPRQLSWPVDDNYLGRLSAAAGCAWVTGFTVIPRTTTTRNRDARQAHHGSSNDQLQSISSAVHSTGGSSQARH